MINIRVTGENASEILEQLTGLVAGALPSDTSCQPVEYPSANKVERKMVQLLPKEGNELEKIVKKAKLEKAKLEKAEPKKAIAEKKAAPKPKAKAKEAGIDSENTADNIDKPTLQKKMKDLLDAGHRDDLAKIFKEHGAKKFSELDSTQYGVVYDEIEALL